MVSSNNTLFVGKVLYKLESVDSTNKYALDLLSKSKPSEGTVILAHNQYAGRGQTTKHWESEPGKNLTLSFILYPTFLAAPQQFYLNQAVALAVLKTLQYFVPKKCTIKWPNDLYVEDRKITGILIQNGLKGRLIKYSVVGIGLNVNQQVFLSDAPNPTSIYLETNQSFTLSSVLDYLCQQLEHYYLALKANRFSVLQQEYLQQLYRFQEWHVYKRVDGTAFNGKIIGVIPTGQLRLQLENGLVEEFALREIRYLI